jgi:protein-disulfide isomerase
LTRGQAAVLIGAAVLFGTIVIRGPKRPRLADEPWKKRGAEYPAVTIVELGDYHCPFSAQLQPILRDARAKYGERAQFVYKHIAPHFPGGKKLLPLASLPGEAAECAADQERFWDFHDELYGTVSDWKSLKSAQERIERFGVYARRMGLDQPEFLECLRSERKRAIVVRNTNEALRLGVHETPTLLLDGVAHINNTAVDIARAVENPR